MAGTDAPSGRQLLQQAEKILLHPIHPHLICYCPTMDLIAVVTDEENLDVYRINGQRAFGLKRKNEDVTIDATQWQFNGKSIAVSWSDGSTDLVSAETGKVSHKDLMLPEPFTKGDIAMDEDTTSRVKCIGWGLNFIDVEAVKRRTGVKQKAVNGTSTGTNAFGEPTTEDWDEFKDNATLEDFLQRQPDFQALNIAPDLPDQLAVMDLESLLPKLPAIPLPPALPFMRVSAADSGSFSSQPQVDSLLHSHHLKDHNSVDMLIRCSDRGTVHPSIYDSLETVNVQLPASWNTEGRPLFHTNHPYSCTHGLLMRTTSKTASEGQRSQFAFVPLTLNFIPNAGIYLHLIASKTSQLQNLLLYITQTLQRLRTFFKNAQDLPSKFMMNISETLEEKKQGDLVTNLFHVACTGSCPPLIREWLVDELAEQGHKRWDNTVTSSFTTLLTLVHENLIPALDRCSIVVSRLRGLAQFHDQDWIFTAPLSHFTGLLEVLRNMRLLAHTVLIYANEEKRQFHAFSKWLRFCIDYEATEPESQSRAEMENRDSGVDISQVLEYIKRGLTNSALTPYLRPQAQLTYQQTNLEPATYDDTKKAIELLKEGATFKEEALCLEYVLGHLTQRVTGLLKQVSSWQQTNIQMDSGVVLEGGSDAEEEQEAMLDMRMVSDNAHNGADTISTYIAIALPSHPSTLHIHRLMHSQNITSLTKDVQSYSISTLDFSATDPNARVLDAKFGDDKNLLVLLQYTDSDGDSAAKNTQKPKQSHAILSLPYCTSSRSNKTTNTPLVFSPLPTTTLSSTLLPTGAPVSSSQRHNISVGLPLVHKHTRHVFEGRFTPLRLVVNGRKGRRVIVVLGSDRKHYRVLDMDFREGKKGRGVSESDSDDDDEEESEDGDGDVEMVEA